MCYCETHEFSINRSDEFMVRDKKKDTCWIIDPESLVSFIEYGLKNKSLKIVHEHDEFKIVIMNDEEIKTSL